MSSGSNKGTIIYFTGLYPPPESANGIRAYYFVRDLVRSGYSVVVVETVSRSDPSVGGFFGERVIRLPLVSSDALSRAADLLYKYFFLRDYLARLARLYRPSVVIASWPSHESIVLGGYLAGLLGIPIIVDIQDLSDYYSLMVDNKLYRKPLFLLYRKIYKVIEDADAIVTVTEPFKRILEVRTSRKDIEVIYNGVDTEIYKEILTSRGISRGDRETLTGIFVGDLNWWYHMLDRIIEALWIIRKISDQRLRIEIIGGGRLAQKYRYMVKRLGLEDIVTFRGYLERKEFAEALIKADFGIIGRPSIPNPWNTASVRTTLYEYMAAGLPIYAFGPSISYIKYLLIANECGYYIDTDNPRVIALELQRFIEMLDRFNRWKIHERSQKYSWASLAKRFTEIVIKYV